MFTNHVEQPITRIAVRAGGHVFWLFFGLASFAVGCNALLSSELFALGLALTVGGICLCGLRTYFVFDSKERCVAKWWRLYKIVPLMRVKQWALESFNAIQIRPDASATDDSGNAITIYTIDLKGRQSIRIAEGCSYLRTRRRAQEIAVVLQLPLRDKCSGVINTTEPHELKVPLRDRLKNHLAHMTLPLAPADGIASILDKPGVKIITLPSTESDWRLMLIAATLCMGIGGAIAYFATSEVARWFVILFFLMAAGIFLRAGWASRYPLVIEVSGSEISTCQSSLFRHRIAISDIEECVLGRREIHLVGQRKWIVIPFVADGRKGKAVGRYLHALITYGVAGDRA